MHAHWIEVWRPKRDDALNEIGSPDCQDAREQTSPALPDEHDALTAGCREVLEAMLEAFYSCL